ncbi:nucleotide exchange factor GrpE [Pseudoramibacter sp.]|uniref:nucleotide exchange factor GrpE n=1 Tax=Pseudoramibacter sp. TaxID=2034862 RepID=UPI0025E753CA|nr:nucleotide exchange factor GrpE [Pseudoramibacter sp.]MCH4071544.1 nucleotide exchange factor GrpE [Pseudoramibacter sp.]MCH4105312.1 nucleotide exchange factor GrpE [Pseudoramibacter sp.]
MAEEEKKQQTAAEEEKQQEKQSPEKEEASSEVKETQQEAPEKEEEKATEKESKEDAKTAALMDQMMRLQADFANYKKRTSREKAEIAAYTTEGLLKKLLPIIDNLERALAATENEDGSKELATGIQMVYKELMKTLKDEGLKEIEAEGKPFDPKYHHGVAIGNEEDVDDQVVLDVFQKGYMYKDKVIRAAMVRINQK